MGLLPVLAGAGPDTAVVRGVRKVLRLVGTLLLAVLVSVALSVAFWAFVYNRSFWYQPPGPKKLEACVSEGGGLEYRWSILEHRYRCHDNWLFPGVHGV